jgi:hypothetical protein
VPQLNLAHIVGLVPVLDEISSGGIIEDGHL